MDDKDEASEGALPEQAAFIEHSHDEHALLAAGPGTGKTWVLERRSVHLVSQGVKPKSIALLTLTNAMVDSLRERIPHGEATTLHSFALTHLNKLVGAWGRRVASAWETRAIVRHDLQTQYQISFGAKCTLGDVDEFIKKLGAAFRNNQSEPSELTDKERRLLQVFKAHQVLFGYAVLDELVHDLVRLLDGGVEMVDPPSHALVDEYQDLTAGELRMLQVLSQKAGTVINACGDDRQSIYGFRKADPLALHRFASVYGLTGVDYLHRSKRLPKTVCDLANYLANTLEPLPGITRPALEPWPGREDEGELHVVQSKSFKAECRYVIDQIASLLTAGVRTGEIMVIASSYHGPVLSALVQYSAGQSFEFVDARKQPAEKAFEELVVEASRRLLSDPEDQMAWRLLTYCCPGLAKGRQRKIFENDGATFRQRLGEASNADPVIRRVVEAGKIVEGEQSGDGEFDEAALAELALKVAAALGLQVNEALVRESAGQAHEPASLDDTQEVPNPEIPENTIAVHTIHSSKGLEKPYVFLMNAIEQSFVGRTDPGDGLRNLFVAVTRSSRVLHISAPRFIRGTQLAAQVGEKQVALAEIISQAAQQVGIKAEAG